MHLLRGTHSTQKHQVPTLENTSKLNTCALGKEATLLTPIACSATWPGTVLQRGYSNPIPAGRFLPVTHLPESPLISSSEKWKPLCHWADRGPDEIKCAVQVSTGMQVLDSQMVVTVIFRLSWGRRDGTDTVSNFRHLQGHSCHQHSQEPRTLAFN